MLFFLSPRVNVSHHVANTFDISTGVIKVCKGWIGLLTFMVIKIVMGIALYVFDLISGGELTIHCLLKWPGKWKATGKTIRGRDPRYAVFEVEGLKQTKWHSGKGEKRYLESTLSATGWKSISGTTHDLAHKVEGTACPSRLQGATEHISAPNLPSHQGNPASRYWHSELTWKVVVSESHFIQ